MTTNLYDLTVAAISSLVAADEHLADAAHTLSLMERSEIPYDALSRIHDAVSNVANAISYIHEPS